MLKRIFERDILKQSFEKRQDNLKDKSAPVSSIDLLLNKAYGAQMAYEMGTDMTNAAIAYSMIDYQETMEANPFKQDWYKHQYNMAAINQRHYNKMKEIEFKALIDPEGGTGGGGVDFGADGSGVEVVTNLEGTEVDTEGFIDRNNQSISEAQNSIDGFELEHLEYAYSNSPQLENAMRGDGPVGTVSYKRAIYDTNGDFTGEYESVNKSWYEARQDLMKYENKGERERLANLTESIMTSTIPADGEGNADLPTDWSLIENPDAQKEFFRQRQHLELMKKQFANAYSQTNGTLAEAYSLINARPHSNKGGMRNAKGWQDDYGMPPMIMPEELYDRLLDGEQYNNIKGEYDLGTTDPADLITLSSDDYVDLGVKMLSHKNVVNQINAIDMSGIKEADLPQFTAKKKANINPFAVLFRSIKYGDGGHKPTLLGNFWDYSGGRGVGQAIKGGVMVGLGGGATALTGGYAAPIGLPMLGSGVEKIITAGKGDWSFNEEKAREYFAQYYDVQKDMISEEIGKPGSNLSGPTDFNYLYKGGNYLGGEGDAKQWNSYRFQYDHLSNNSKAGKIAIAELKNIMNMINGHPDTFTTLIGNQGTQPPWSQHESGMSKKKWDRKIRKGNLNQKEMELSMQMLRQFLNDVQRSDKTKSAPAASILYSQYINADGEDMGSYTITFDEEYSDKLNNVLGDPKKDGFAAEFKETNSITLYFDRAVDNSPYKASNQTFSPIQADLDTTGEPYTQNWPQVGSYTFYKNGSGGYSARVQPVIFDSKSGNRRLDDPFTLAVDPNTTSFENLAIELEAYLYDLARQNNDDQNAYKYSFAQWQALNERKRQ